MKCYDNNLLSINAQSLAMFLERNGEPRPISPEDIYSIIGRYDKEGDDCISYEEFEAAILPAKDKQHTNLEEDDDQARFSTPKK